ncbi:PREDICTED: ankyrin-1-like, partial [Amphimedon queenslandica]|uniref:ANK_REP_REGION domain-containing protein n=1 Tax=Amphimedon queenslandica TaxID=400682 RepID=A0AAN0IRJ2_AMPQE
QYLIEVQDSDINITDNKKWNALDHSAGSGNMKLVQYLINNHQLPLTSIALLQAVCSTKLSLIKLLVNEYKLDLQVKSCDGMQAVHCAAQVAAIDVLEYLVKDCGCDLDRVGGVDNLTFLIDVMKCDVTTEDKIGYTCVTRACESVEEHQLDLTIKDYNGMAPVHVACEEGSLNIVKYIIDHSPLSLDMTDSFGRTPLLIAAFSKNLPIIRYLNSKTCNISILDDKGFNVIHISAKGGSLDILRFFVDGRYCNPDITDASGRTPLYLSAQEGHLEIVEYLLDSPSYNKPRVELVDMADSNGNTALHAACSQGHPDIVSTIAGAYKSLNIDIYSINEKRQTPLHLAAANGHVNTAVSFLSATTGTSNHEKLLGAVDGDGCSPLHLACQNGHYRMTLYLSEVYPANVYS